MLKIRKELESIPEYKPGRPIEEVKRSLGLKVVYKLASNECCFSPLYLRKVILKELENINRYPEANSFYLRSLLSQLLRVSPEQIVFGNGSDEIITFTLRAFIDKDDEVIVAYPTFLIYEMQARIQRAKVIRVPLKNFHYDLEAIRDALTSKTKIIFIANPDNPTGTYINHSQLVEFLKDIPPQVIVYLDEAYYEFAPKDFPKSLELLKGRKNLIVSRTFSKAFALAGLRIGYGITCIEIANLLNRIREPFNVNRFAQVAAISALKNKRFLNRIIKHVDAEKDYLYKELKALGIDFIESATNFVLIDFKKECSFLCDYLLRKGIIVRAMEDWGLKDFVRVTIGTRRENRLFIKYLKDYFKKEEVQ